MSNKELHELENQKPRRRKPRGGQKNMDMLLEDYLHDESFEDMHYEAERKIERDMERVNRRKKRNRKPRRTNDDLI